MDHINALATERHELYKAIAKFGKHGKEIARIKEITAQLPDLWDSHRREIVDGENQRREQRRREKIA